MLSSKPYLMRAFYDWIVDSGCTPFVLINASNPRSRVPREFVRDGQITLNIAPAAIRDLVIRADAIEFRASFSGVIHVISAPMRAVLAVYAEENGRGMFFDQEDNEEGTEGEGAGVTQQLESHVAGAAEPVILSEKGSEARNEVSSSVKNVKKRDASHLRVVE